MNKPTAKRYEPNFAYPEVTLICLQCLNVFVNDEFKFCPYCGTEIVLQEEEEEKENDDKRHVHVGNL